MDLFSNTVVSIALFHTGHADLQALREVARVAQAAFPYYELLVVANPADGLDELEREVAATPNTRCLIMNAMAPLNVLREAAFEQSIGDYLVLFDPAEADPALLPRLVATNIEGNSFTGLEYARDDISFYSLAGRSVFWLIRKLTGYALNARISLTGCYSRSLINAINSQGMGQSQLRLLLASLAFQSGTLPGAVRRERGLFKALRRLGDCVDIIGSVPHRLLLVTAWLSFLCFLANIGYMGYVALVWLFAAQVQPGWTTTSLISSFLFGMLFFTFFVFSCIFSHALTKSNRGRFSIVRDISRSDFIASFTERNELNVTDKS